MNCDFCGMPESLCECPEPMIYRNLATQMSEETVGAPYCEECETYHPEGVHGQWIDRKDLRHSEYPNGKEDEFVPS